MAQFEFAQPVSAYLQGRAMQMAYRNDKLQQQVLQAQVDALPQQMEMQRQMQALEFMERTAKLQAMLNPEQPKFLSSRQIPGATSNFTLAIEPGGKVKQIRPDRAGGRKTEVVQEGTDSVTYEVMADGTRREIGRGPKFNPNVGSGAGGAKAPKTEPWEGVGEIDADGNFSPSPEGKRYKGRRTWDAEAGQWRLDMTTVAPVRPTESEARTAELSNAMEIAAAQIDRTGIGTRAPPSIPQRLLFETAIDPKSGRFSRAFADAFQDKDAVAYFDTALAFIDPIVRKRTGAAVRAEEFPNFLRMFFPVPGEGAEGMARKAERRRLVQIALRAGSGNIVPRFTESTVAEMEAEGRAIEAGQGGGGMADSWEAAQPGQTYRAPDGTVRRKR